MDLTQLAREAIKHFLETGQPLKPPADIPTEFNYPAGAFVTLDQPKDELRGCIGTIAPTQPNVAAEVIANAILAATQDDRFPPVARPELDRLTISVDVLTPPTPIPDPSHLDPQHYGLIVTAADGRQGVLLPDLPGVIDPAEQIAICRQKADINPAEPVQLATFEVHRYHETN